MRSDKVKVLLEVRKEPNVTYIEGYNGTLLDPDKVTYEDEDDVVAFDDAFNDAYDGDDGLDVVVSTATAGGAWWPSGSTLAFHSEGRGFGPAGRHAIFPGLGPRHCSVPGRAWLAEFGGECRSPGDGAGYWFGRPCFLLK